MCRGDFRPRALPPGAAPPPHYPYEEEIHLRRVLEALPQVVAARREPDAVPVVPFAELTMIKELGRGTSGVVYQVRWQMSDTFALKVFRCGSAAERDQVAAVVRKEATMALRVR